MNIVANIKGYGEQRLFLVPDPNYPDSRFFLVLSQDDLDSPQVVLELKGDRFEIVTDNSLLFYETQEKTAFDERLTQLARDVRDALVRGEDLAASDLPEHPETVKPYDPELIDVREAPMSVQQVYLMICDGDINLSPDFQRNVVWDSKRKSRLIESMLLRIPLPVFYFSQGKDGKLAVVDGLQRLTAIKAFMDDMLPLSELEYLTELNGLTYSQLKRHDLYWRRLKLTKLSANVIQPGSPTKVRYDIFRRLNTGGRPLNNQELRNCMASPALRESLKRMAHSYEFKLATGNSIDDNRMEAQEMALRFMRFWDWMSTSGGISAYKGEMDAVLDEWTEEVSQSKDFPFGACEQDFINSMINAHHLFGRHAFRKVFTGHNDSSHRSLLNKALFLSFSVVLSRFVPAVVKDKVGYGGWIGRLADIIDSDTEESREIMRLLSYGTNGAKNIRAAFDIAERLASELQ